MLWVKDKKFFDQPVKNNLRTYDKIRKIGLTALIVSNEEMHGIMKLVKYLEEPRFTDESIIKIIKNETKEQRGWFLGMLSGTWGAILLWNLLADK